MKNFGETIRALRKAQELGLRETAIRLGISPAYLSRIERDKETPPRSEVIKKMAQIFAADPDVLFRLASSTDPEVVEYLNQQPQVMSLIRFLKTSHFSSEELNRLIETAGNIKSSST